MGAKLKAIPKSLGLIFRRMLTYFSLDQSLYIVLLENDDKVENMRDLH